MFRVDVPIARNPCLTPNIALLAVTKNTKILPRGKTSLCVPRYQKNPKKNILLSQESNEF